MVAHPDVSLEKAADQHQVVARQAMGDERVALWSTVIEREPSLPGPGLENE